MPFAGGAGLIAVAAGAALIATVFAALYHAEVVANRTGEPCGTPVLAVAVVIIEVTLIVSVMIAAPGEKAGLARDTVFAAVMMDDGSVNVGDSGPCPRGATGDQCAAARLTA